MTGWRAAPHDAHEWLSFEDPDEDRTWVFDVTFLLSDWRCIFGDGCEGVLTGPAAELGHGCCSYGAHFTGDDDIERVERAVALLSPDEWQFHRKGRRNGAIKRTKQGEVVTRLHDGACILLNRPGFAGGIGCALHVAALRRGERPVDWKPEVCWQLPLRREDSVGDDGHVTSTVRQWDRRHWGDGGFEFHWWCMEAPEAFTADTKVYRSLRDEIVELVGEKPYAMVAAELDERVGTTYLPHPAVRRR